MYSYGQFCKTPIGRMRVRKATNRYMPCFECKVRNICGYNLVKFCTKKLPGGAYLEKPNVGGKDQHK